MPLPTSAYSPLYNPGQWNRPVAVATNNCYSYSMNMPQNPLTAAPWGDPAVGYKPQPGELSGLDMMENGSNILECVCADLAMCARYTFNRALNYYAPVTPFCYRVYLIADLQIPIDAGALGIYSEIELLDYHWYVQNSQANSNQQFWSHKPGLTPVINTDPANVIIENPAAIDISPYNTRLGFLDVEGVAHIDFPADDGQGKPDPPEGAAANMDGEAPVPLPYSYEQLKQIPKGMSFQELIEKLSKAGSAKPRSIGSGFHIIAYDWKDTSGNLYTLAFNFKNGANGLRRIYLIDSRQKRTFIL